MSPSIYELGHLLRSSQSVSALLDVSLLPSHGSASKFAAIPSSNFSTYGLSSHLLIRSSMLPILIIRCSTAALPCTVTPFRKSTPQLRSRCSIHRLGQTCVAAYLLTSSVLMCLVLSVCSFLCSFLSFRSCLLFRRGSSFKWSEIGSCSAFSGRKSNACG